jgi:hypothetical protein
MSTLSGKPANPIDLSAYALQRAGERAERQSVENDRDTPRSPYAPKEAPRRSAADTDPDVRSDAAPLAPVRASEGLRERSARHAADADDAQDSNWPRASAQGGRGHSAHTAYDEDVQEHPADLDALRSSETAGGEWYEQPASAQRDAVMGGNDLERLESSLRWLQRQEAATAATHLPPAPGLPPGPGLDARGRRQGGDRFAGDLRSPLSLEPERMAPPPLTSGDSNLRWAVYALIAAAVAAPVAFYFSSNSGSSRPEPVARPQLASTDSPQALAPAVRQEPAPTVARDEDPEIRDPSAQSTRASKTAKLPSRLPEGEAVAMLPPPATRASPPPAATPMQPQAASPMQPQAAIPQAAAPSFPVRTLDQAEISLLTKQGEQFIAAGDLVTARMVFQRAAEAGDAYAAMALGATYDPGVLAKLGVVGMSADVEKARNWYQKAESLGSAEATKRLRMLANR